MLFLNHSVQVFFALCLFLISSHVQAQDYQRAYANKIWQKLEAFPDFIRWSSSVLDNSENLIVTGNTFNTSGQGPNIITTKYASNGDTIWSVEYNGALGLADYGAAVTVDGSGDVYVAGASMSSSAYSFDIVTVKYNGSDGSLLWDTVYNGPVDSNDYATGITIDNLGSIYVIGASMWDTLDELDYVTIKYAAEGEDSWIENYDYNSLTDIPCCISVSTNGAEVIVTGGSGTEGDTWANATISYDEYGTQTNEEREPAAGADLKHPKDMVKDGDGNLYLTGSTIFEGHPTVKVIKLNSSLVPVWTTVYEQPDVARAYSLDRDASGNIYVVGAKEYISGKSKALVLKLNSSGSIVSDHADGLEDEVTSTEAVRVRVSGDNIIIVGTIDDGSRKDMFTAAIDQYGNMLW